MLTKLNSYNKTSIQIERVKDRIEYHARQGENSYTVLCEFIKPQVLEYFKSEGFTVEQIREEVAGVSFYSYIISW